MVRKLIANRVTEKDVRDHLTSHGYDGNAARFDYLDLVAIERPGWIQVFKFSVNVFDGEGVRHHFLGVVRDDERSSMEIYLGDTDDEQTRVAECWSTGLIRAGRQPLGRTQWVLLAVFAAVVAFALLGAVLSGSVASP